MSGLAGEMLSFLDIPVSGEASAEAGVTKSTVCLEALVIWSETSPGIAR